MRADQWAICQHPAKVKVLAMGRRWGKSVLGQVVSVGTAAAGGRVAWCVPNYRNGNPLWRAVKQATAQLVTAKVCAINNTDRTVEFSNGGGIAIYSMDNPDSIRGESFHVSILDEAAMMAEGVWQEAIQPTLADHDGDAIIISTPKGRNWFYDEWRRGKRDMREIAAFTAPSSANPNPNIQKAARRAKERISDRAYRQEWLAEFLEDGGGVFRGVRAAATLPKVAQPVEGHSYVFGLDWGRMDDNTVITVIDATARQVVLSDAFTGIGYATQRGRIKAAYEKWRPYDIVAEANSMGLPNIEALQLEGLPVTAFTTTNASKQQAIDTLALAFEREQIKLVVDEDLIGELEAFEMSKSPSGLQRFGAPKGKHDDRVMSLAIGWSALDESGPLLLWGDDAGE
jgi:phage terminase large subunit-like protein